MLMDRRGGILDTGVPVSQIKKGVISRASKFYFFADMATQITEESFRRIEF
jgi:hypothetical protein